jgi:hypothetical protein
VEVQLAASFDRTADDYERGRPEWPLAVVDALALPPAASAHGVSALFAGYRRPAAHPGSRFDSGEWLEAFAGAPVETVVRWEQTLDRDAMVAYHASLSWVAALPEVEREGLLGELRALLPDVEYRRAWRAHVLIFAHSSI